MRVLFLDIDGVCNSRLFAERVYRRTGKRMWLDVDPELVQHVRRIIKETDCKVVLSSTWRLYPEAVAVVERDVCRILDCTKDMQAGKKRGVVDRGYEVQEWLNRHPEVKHYAIVDDSSDFFPEQWLFKTTFAKGITPEITDAIIYHLNAGGHHVAGVF